MSKYHFETFKYAVPLVWVDTNVIIDMARVKSREDQDAKVTERADKLYKTLYRLTRDEKIIYLDAEQRREFGLNPQLYDECNDIQIKLSFGVFTSLPYLTHKFQMQRMMKVYLGKLDNFYLDERDIFMENPLENLQRAKKTGLIISVKHTPSEWERNESLRVRDDITKDWEFLRQARVKESITYEKALDLEYGAELNVVRNKLIKEFQNRIKGIQPSFEDLWKDIVLLDPLHWWLLESGKRDDLEKGLTEFTNFIFSEAYRSIPSVEIKSKLLAYLSVAPTPVSRGDYLDTEHLSAVLPYCDVIITDSALKHRLIELKLTEKFSKKVFSLKDIDDVLAYLESL